jgi:hypothetical protein
MPRVSILEVLQNGEGEGCGVVVPFSTFRLKESDIIVSA